MPIPKLLPTAASHEAFAGVAYQVDGELVPALHVQLGDVPVYFEHHVLLWKEPRVEIGLKSLKGAFKRILSGMPIFMTEAQGPGHISFSRDGAGHIFGMHLTAGQALDVREHQFLAATEGVDFTFKRVRGIASLLLGGSGFFIDTFSCPQGEGIVWLHGYGNVFEVTLQAGQQIDVEPGGWIYQDCSVRMETVWVSVERASDVAIGHIPARIVVGANDDHAGMPAAGGLDQNVQIAEVVVVLGDQHELVPNRVQQMKRIPYSRRSRVVWQDDAVARAQRAIPWPCHRRGKDSSITFDSGGA